MLRSSVQRSALAVCYPMAIRRLSVRSIDCRSSPSMAICPSTTVGPSLGHSPRPFSRPLSANRRHHSAAVPPIAATLDLCWPIATTIRLLFGHHSAATIRLFSAATRPLFGHHFSRYSAITRPLFGYHFSRCLATTWPLSGGFKEASDLSKPMRREILDILALSKFGVIFTNCNYFIIFLTLINHRHKPNISSSKKTSWTHKLLHDNEDIQGIIILT